MHPFQKSFIHSFFLFGFLQCFCRPNTVHTLIFTTCELNVSIALWDNSVFQEHKTGVTVRTIMFGYTYILHTFLKTFSQPSQKYETETQSFSSQANPVLLSGCMKQQNFINSVILFL